MQKMKNEIISTIRTGNKKRVIFSDVNGKTQTRDFDGKLTDDDIKKKLEIPVSSDKGKK
tara:strand:+ start:425 stop:601 length:177 start_codon:yes stop_codon:yes gene_type:complete